MKITAIPNNTLKKCNCFKPIFMTDLNGTNPQTGRFYTEEDRKLIKSSLYRIANARGCQLSSCCDANASFDNIDSKILNDITSKFSHYQLIKKNGILDSILLWDKQISNGESPPTKSEHKWLPIEPYIICKISKAEIGNYDASHEYYAENGESKIKIAKKILQDCFIDNCDNLESITLQNILNDSKIDLNSTYVDDMSIDSAIRDHNIPHMKEYIRKYKVINHPLSHDSLNNRIIHLVSQYGNDTMMDLILALKPDLNISNVYGNTPLHIAAESNNFNHVEKLLNQGVNPNITNSKGESPINMAIKSGNFSIIRLLYNNGSGVLGLDNNGNTLLHYTIIYAPENKDKLYINNWLLEHGLNSEKVNNQGKTALELTKIKIDNLEKKEYIAAKGITIIDPEMKLENTELVDILEEFNDNALSNAFDIARETNWFSNFINYFSTSDTIPNTIPNTISNTIPNTKPVISKMSVTNNAKPEKLTQAMKNLLEIQTALFNNIITNNPQKYQTGYFNIKELPKGAPIEALFNVCKGVNVSGTEDSAECIDKGGKMIKIKDATTRIKLEIISHNDMAAIDDIKQKELMLPKYQNLNNDSNGYIDLPEVANYNKEYKEKKEKKEKNQEHADIIDENSKLAQSAKYEAFTNSSILYNKNSTKSNTLSKLKSTIIIILIILMCIYVLWLIK